MGKEIRRNQRKIVGIVKIDIGKAKEKRNYYQKEEYIKPKIIRNR